MSGIAGEKQPPMPQGLRDEGAHGGHALLQDRPFLEVRRTEPTAQREYLQTLQRESDRLARVVENVLAWSRLDEGRFTARRAQVGLLAPVEYAQIPASAVLGMLFFAEQPGWTLLWGTLIMVGATLYLARSAGR